jgi:hypothetical protein
MGPPIADPREIDVVDARRERPIEDYGLIGDTRTAALVASDGAIDWMCVPRFDGPPVFGRLVGGSDAGTFRLGPSEDATVFVRRYRPGTATLETTWRAEHGRLTLREGMIAENAGTLMPTTLLVRRITAEGGPVKASNSDPRFGSSTDGSRPTPGRHPRCNAHRVALSALHRYVSTREPTTVIVTPDQPSPSSSGRRARATRLRRPGCRMGRAESDEQRCSW